MGDAAEGAPKAIPLTLATQDGAVVSGYDETRGGGGGPPTGGGTAGDDEGEPIFASEFAMANVLVSQRLNGDWRYVPRANDAGDWYNFLDGQCWRIDVTDTIASLAHGVCQETANLALRVPPPLKPSPSLARKLASFQTMQAVVKVARTDQRIATPITAFDRDLYSINTPRGIVELKNGLLLPPDKTRLCRRITGAAPYGDCPHWRRFLEEVTGGDEEYQRYLQRLAGYSLCGDKSEEIFVFLYGPSNTGKSKFVECMRLLHGDYGIAAPMNSFLISHIEQHSTDIAGFVGRRLVTASETEEGRRWDQQRLTTLTGRDRVSARFMRGNFFEYMPTFLLMFHGNWRPRIGAVSDALRRRMHLLPFMHKPVKIDQHLLDKFRGELDGIMAWALRGCLEWQEQKVEKLGPPAKVTAATDEYFELEDTIGHWVDEQCDVDPLNTGALYAGSRELYSDFVAWQKSKGWVLSESIFVGRLELLQGVKRSPRLPNGKRGFYGIALKRRQTTLDLK
jgi:putative DNA primase/helicase